MDVIAYAGAVGRRIVVPENFQSGAFPLDGLQDDRNQVRLWIMVLPNRSALVGSCCVEVTEANKAQAIGVAVSLQSIFQRQLGSAVGIYWLSRTVLRDRRFFGSAIDRGRRGENKLAHPRIHDRIEQCQRGS